MHILTDIEIKSVIPKSTYCLTPFYTLLKTVIHTCLGGFTQTLHTTFFTGLFRGLETTLPKTYCKTPKRFFADLGKISTPPKGSVQTSPLPTFFPANLSHPRVLFRAKNNCAKHFKGLRENPDENIIIKKSCDLY